MADVIIENIGRIVSGDLGQPLLDGDTIVIRNGKFSEIGARVTVKGEGIEHVINAGGCVVMPGLIDSHMHPVFGDYTPRQRTVDFIDELFARRRDEHDFGGRSAYPRASA